MVDIAQWVTKGIGVTRAHRCHRNVNAPGGFKIPVSLLFHSLGLAWLISWLTCFTSTDSKCMDTPLVSQTAPSQECLVHLTHRLSFIAVSAGPSMELGTSRPQQEGRRKVLFSFFQFLYCDADTCYCNLSLLDIQHAVLPKEEINKKVLSRDFILQEQTEIVIVMAPC